MTQHVRTSYRKHRRAAWGLAVLAATAVALVMFVAMAGAANAPSTKGVTPTLVDLGGQANDCSSSQVQSAAEWDFRVVNPINGTTYTDTRTGASFQITLDANQIFLGFVGTKAAVYDLVVKGGQKSSWYDYDGTASVGPVASDSMLHAPAKGNTYFPVSHVSFCYSTKASISGTVYNDLNGNGALTTSSPAEPGLSGWTVTAYKSDGTVAATAGPTGASGSYALSNLTLGATYAVCAMPSSGLWATSEPTTTPSRCSASPTGRGWQFQLDASTTKNFGNERTTSVVCNQVSNSTDDANDQVKPSSQCGKISSETGTEFVFSSWSDATGQFVGFHPASGADCGPPSGSTCSYFVERLTWTGLSNAQTPLKYDDKRDANGNLSFEPMLFCKKDPRSSAPDGLTLEPGTAAADVLPNVTRTDGDPTTSCLITTTNSVDASGARGAVDIVFNVGDGYGGR